MSTEGMFQIAVILAALLCSLVAGFLFAFAVVVMPGIGSLDDRAFIRAFQVMDRVIQNNQPLFMVVWIGSVVSLIASVVLGIRHLDGVGRLLITFSALGYLFCVQLPTVTINVPLNNKLQMLDAGAMTETEQKAARQAFEPSWNRWNSFRTVFACLASALLNILVFRL